MSWYSLMVVFSLVLVSCRRSEKIGLKFDEVFFEFFGETLFIKPELVSFKEVHLGLEQVDKKFVKVTGQVIDLGNHETYIVIGNKEDRLIVATTASYRSSDQKLNVGSNVGVVGVIEAGKKGMPFLRAYAINIQGS